VLLQLQPLAVTSTLVTSITIWFKYTGWYT